MKVILKKPYKYSENGNDVIDCPAGEADIPESNALSLIGRGLATKAGQVSQNKAKNKPKNKGR